MENKIHKPIVLAILDGWGISPSWGGNAISMNSPKTMNFFWKNYPHIILHAFRQVAGNYKMVGNSEIGHSSIGAGKIVFQDLERISKSIENKSFFQNEVLIEAMKNSQSYNSSLHLIGLVSNGGIHSHIDHLYALLKMAKLQHLPKVYIHLITDGLDTELTSAMQFVAELEKKIMEIGVGEIATISGRMYAMDRDNRWDNIAKVVDALVNGNGNFASSASKAISAAYRSGLCDQNISPTVIKKNNRSITKISYNDSVIFYNFRPDRSRELTLALLGLHDFGAKIKAPQNLKLVTFTSYYLPAGSEKRVSVAFPSEKIDQTLGKIISDNGLKQFRIAESEKSSHISYFFNCGFEQLLPGEERVIVESPRVASYAEKPEMSAIEVAKKLVEAIAGKKFDFILVNFANVDSVGHSGDLLAATQAVAVVDECMENVWNAVSKVDGTLIITADHGNAEQMIGVTGSHDRETFHTLSPVPFILLRNDLKTAAISTDTNSDILADMVSSKNSLADIAPTILELFGIEIPLTMNGKSLLAKIIRRSGGDQG